MNRIATFLILMTLGGMPLCAMPAQMNFQGTLKQQGIPVNTTKNMQFSFVDKDGNQLPGTTVVSITNVPVTNGLFAVQLPIDPAIPWDQYAPYIRVSVDGQMLSPDQPVSANLYAVSAIPPGIIVPFGGQTPPPGWFLCDGSSKSRAQYAGLFQAIGTAWGDGDGSTSFNLPDLRGRTAIGAGQGANLTYRALGDATLGEETHTLSIAEMPTHSHGINDPGHSHGGQNGNAFMLASPPGDVAFGAGAQITPVLRTGTSTTGISIQSQGNGSAHNLMQPSAVVNYIIKL
jgi:microcystin-dependent protein